MSEATPGPWRVVSTRHPHRDTFWREILDADDNVLGEVYSDIENDPFIPDDVAEANATLIAAAPDLVEALKDTLALARLKFGNLDAGANQIFANAEAALTKAGVQS